MFNRVWNHYKPSIGVSLFLETPIYIVYVWHASTQWSCTLFLLIIRSRLFSYKKSPSTSMAVFDLFPPRIHLVIRVEPWMWSRWDPVSNAQRQSAPNVGTLGLPLENVEEMRRSSSRPRWAVDPKKHPDYDPYVICNVDCFTIQVIFRDHFTSLETRIIRIPEPEPITSWQKTILDLIEPAFCFKTGVESTINQTMRKVWNTKPTR